MARPSIVHQASDPNGRSIVIRKDPEWDEYIVQFFDGAQYLHLSDYFTPQWDDAHATAMLYLKKGF